MINKNNLPLKKNLYSKDIKVFALGGLGEVGKNLYCIEIADELLVIDSGVLFSNENVGVDYIVPDFTYLKENEHRIIGLFITHGHEDHIGGIPYLLRAVKIPKVYASGLAYELIKNKMKEFSGVDINLIEYRSDSVYVFNNFIISFFLVNHSIPDAFGMAIKTKLGYIIHTGDFKFDFTPIGDAAEFEKITSYQKEGVLLLLSDSTGSEIEDFSLSEKAIAESIRTIFETIEGRVIIATFASNVYRLQTMISASVEYGRKVVAFGRSMEKNINVAQQLKYIEAPKGTFIHAREFPHIPNNQITILCTGSQGEPFAALSRIADGTHKTIQIEPGDTIIFSSSAIPGNELNIYDTINKLYKRGARVIVDSPLTDTHTTGHASKTEQEIMLALTKPKYFVPIHGEYAMLKEHSKTAERVGVKEENIFILENGDVLTITKDGASITDKITTGNIYIDSKRNIVDPEIIKTRKHLSEEGLLSIVLSLDEKYKLRRELSIITRGFIYAKESDDLLQKIEERALKTLDNYIATSSKYNKKDLSALLVSTLSTYIFELTERKPLIIPVIIEQ
ncbi:MAG TPA: ribonuclease J [Bacilli bacterium]|nr:ribonuclease J [Bacilli bacterium]HOR53013.1 ribonuclease J [Bacilli bacterium]HPL58722.1 ribonuclease J [Bacilli bacterium]